MLMLSACKKKAVAPAPPAPPPAEAPTASLSANPASIQQGQSTTLNWRTSNATDVTLEGFGRVGATGTQTVSPTDSTTYRLTAKGPGGTQDATTRVTVTQPPPPSPISAPTASEAQQFAANVHDIYFGYDKYDIGADQQATLQADARWLAAHPNVSFTLGGYCDERGSTEYNLALGDNRANAVKQALVQAGIGANRIKTISYGKERPFCTEHTEACWQQNRRAQFVYGQ
jgi:peptidoglycan-associated lipoprotein